MKEPSYLHVVEGRLRVKVPEVKRCPDHASEVESYLTTMAGIQTVKANPRTANVLVLFDPQQTNHDQILTALRKISSFEVPVTPFQMARERIARTVVQSVVQAALERMILALV